MVANMWKQPNCVPLECMEKQNVEKEIVHRATAWMNTEDTMLSETSQSQKDEYCMVPLV